MPPRFYVTSGDLTRTVSVDAIVTLINPGGLWFGGVDSAIQRVAGMDYHAQAAGVMVSQNGLENGQVIVAKGLRRDHHGGFHHVIFVVDDLVSPLADLVFNALMSAKHEGFKSVAFPMMRTGVMLGEVEPDVEAVAEQMRIGIERFMQQGEVELDIYVVVYQDQVAVKLIDGALKQLEGQR